MAGHNRPKDGVLSPAYIPHDDRTHCLSTVMPALVEGIHVFSRYSTSKTWMPGTRPGMTEYDVAA